MNKDLENKWKTVAIDLAKVLRRMPYTECNELDHSGGFLHSHDNCPVVFSAITSLRNFDNLLNMDVTDVTCSHYACPRKGDDPCSYCGHTFASGLDGFS